MTCLKGRLLSGANEVSYFYVGDVFCIHLGTKYANFQEKIFAEISHNLCFMINPGECQEWPCIAGIYELELDVSHHVHIYSIYDYSIVFIYNCINSDIGLLDIFVLYHNL